MRGLTLIFIFFYSHLAIAQSNDTLVNTTFVSSFKLDADTFIGNDEFNNLYYIKNNTFYKKNDKEILSYKNVQLGDVTSVDIKNPLKIILFYQNFNKVVLLDSNLNALSNEIDFSFTTFSKNITLVTGASTNNLWLYSFDDNTLQRYNYQTDKIQSTSQSLSFNQADFKAKALVSSYKECWLLGENSVLKFNEYGTFLEQIEISKIDKITAVHSGFVFLQDQVLYRYKKEVVERIHLKKEISIKSFYVNKNEIHIFDGTTISVFSFTN